MKRYVVALLVVLGLVGVVGALAVGTGFAKDETAGAKCSEATLHGRYLFAFDGVDITGKKQSPFAVAGYDVFHGNGKVNSVVSANFDGEIVSKQHASSTYKVKADCTGTISDTGDSQIDLFIAPDGSRFTFVLTDPGVVASGSELRGTAKRVVGN